MTAIDERTETDRRIAAGDFTGLLEVMTAEDGDAKVAWDSSRPDEVEVARAAFDKAVQKGSLVYATNAAGERGQRVRDFDPAVERLVVVPALQGG